MYVWVYVCMHACMHEYVCAYTYIFLRSYANDLFYICHSCWLAPCITINLSRKYSVRVLYERNHIPPHLSHSGLPNEEKTACPHLCPCLPEMQYKRMLHMPATGRASWKPRWSCQYKSFLRATVFLPSPFVVGGPARLERIDLSRSAHRWTVSMVGGQHQACGKELLMQLR